MSEEKVAHEEILSYRGYSITIQRTWIDHGTGTPIERRWYVGTHPNAWFRSEEAATNAAKRSIDYEVDGTLSFDDWFTSIFDEPDDYDDPIAIKVEVVENALDARIAKLRQVTVARGATPAEEDTAKRKIDALIKKRKR